MKRYTKADLKELVYSQLENLNAMHDLLSIMKHQNGLIENANKKLKDEISEFKDKQVKFPTRRRSKSLSWRVGDLSSFGFLGLALCDSKNQMCLNVRLVFLHHGMKPND